VSNIVIKKERDAKTAALTQATTESARAKAVSDLLQEMLGSADAARAKGVDYKVRELLDDFSAGLGSQLTGQPEVEADIHATIGRAYRSVKRPDQAQPHFEKAIELRRRDDGPRSEKLAAVMVDGAWNLLDQQRHAEAETQANDALKIYRGRGITGAPLFHALEILQHILISAKRDEDAERVTKEALTVARQSGQEFPDQANLLHRYADMKTRQGNFAEAEQFASQAVDMHRRLHGDRHPETAWGLKALARALVPQKKLTEAEAAVRESLTIFRHQFPDDHENVRDTIYQLKAVLEARGDKPALEALAKEEAVYSMRSGTPEYHIRLGELLTRQSITVHFPEDAQRLSEGAAARTEEARRQFREAIEAYDRMAMERSDDLERRYRALDGYTFALKHCAAAPGFESEVDELNRRLEAEIPKLLAAFPNSSDCQWKTATLYNSWGKVLSAYSEHLSTVEHAFSQAIDMYKTLSLSDPDRPYVWIWLASVNARLGDVRLRLGRLDDAKAPLRTAVDIYHQHAEKIAADIAADPYPGINLEITFVHALYAFVLVATNREQEAAEVIRMTALSTKQLTVPAELASALWIISAGQLWLGDEAGYRATCKAMADLPADTFDELTKRRQIYLWCLAPNALDDLSLPIKRAEELADSNLLGQPHIPPFNLGMALYRDGQYDRAAQELAKSIDVYPKHPLPGYEHINHQRLWLAMARWKQGQRDEARRLVAEALPGVDDEIQNPLTWLHYRAFSEILRREAVALIEPNEADDAADNRTNNESSSNSVKQAPEKMREH
jgi:tetratricopeptide (TPR) repeat protein